MGVYHFMGLGRSPEIVSFPIDYFQEFAKKIATGNKINSTINWIEGTGSLRLTGHDEPNLGFTEAIILFTSKEIVREEESFKDVKGKVISYLKSVWKIDSVESIDGIPKKRELYWVIVNHNDYLESLQKIVYTIRKFSKKEIWINLTGGTNAITTGLINGSYLTGKAVKIYAIPQKFDKNAQFRLTDADKTKIGNKEDDLLLRVPFIPTNVDFEKTLKIVEIFDNEKKPISLDSLKSKLTFTIETEELKSILVKLNGTYLNYDKENQTNCITEEGSSYLDQLMKLEIADDENLKEEDFIIHQTLD